MHAHHLRTGDAIPMQVSIRFRDCRGSCERRGRGGDCGNVWRIFATFQFPLVRKRGVGRQRFQQGSFDINILTFDLRAAPPEDLRASGGVHVRPSSLRPPLTFHRSRAAAAAAATRPSPLAPTIQCVYLITAMQRQSAWLCNALLACGGVGQARITYRSDSLDGYGYFGHVVPPQDPKADYAA